jgi:hypothetical protein
VPGGGQLAGTGGELCCLPLQRLLPAIRFSMFSRMHLAGLPFGANQRLWQIAAGTPLAASILWLFRQRIILSLIDRGAMNVVTHVLPSRRTRRGQARSGSERPAVGLQPAFPCRGWRWRAHGAQQAFGRRCAGSNNLTKACTCYQREDQYTLPQMCCTDFRSETTHCDWHSCGRPVRHTYQSGMRQFECYRIGMWDRSRVAKS